MTWLVPSALAIAAGAAILVAALHFIARSRPLAEPLPTARFVPHRPIHARARSVALTDALLMLVRIAAVLALGLAIAAPVFTGRGQTRRIVLLDRSRAVGNAAEVRDSAAAWVRPADIVIPFDTMAPLVSASRDSSALAPARGSLSVALAAALRAGSVLPPRTDSVELVIVSPFATEEFDEATEKLRAAWPGRVRVVPVTSARGPAVAARAMVTAAPNDAVAAGLALMGAAAPAGTDADVHVVRTRLTAADSLWARTGGHVLVHWPAADSSAIWPKRSTIDAIGGVTTSTGTLVARFPRLWLIEGPPVARWSDGEPAAVERMTGSGCIRDVGLLIDQASDVTLHPAFRRFATALLAPCGGTRHTESATTAELAAIVGRGPLAAASLLHDRTADVSPWTLWLLVAGALLLLVELAMRRGRASTL